MIFPSKQEFLTSVAEGGIPPVYTELPYCSPCIIYEVLAGTNSFLLESVKGPEKIARYSFIGIDPCLEFRIKNSVGEIITAAGRQIVHSSKPSRILKNLMSAYRQVPQGNLSPFQGGMVGIFSYDYVHYLEKLPRTTLDDLNLPDAHFLMMDKCVVVDHRDRKCWIILCPGLRDMMTVRSETCLNWQEQYDKAVSDLETIRRKIVHGMHEPFHYELPPRKRLSGRKIDIVYEMKKKAYMNIVMKAKEYIAAGDIFQSNLSQRVSAHIEGKNTWNLYKILRAINPSPFASYMDFGSYRIVSSSPERLLRVMDGTIETRPIAGTRPRGKDYREDEMMRSELLLNEKERAEHIMLIDLERNDIGRVSDYGSVRVDEMMITEDYSHVIHIVSNVTGDLAQGKDCFDALKAAFPGGTITGVPKVRCMEIIDELEPVNRGPYTGSIGYIGFSGNMDLNIVIRTFVIKDDIAYVQAGAGIVTDSDPEREYHEALKKAEALIKTLEMV